MSVLFDLPIDVVNTARMVILIMGLTFWYKRNPMWVVLQGLVVGAFVSTELVGAATSIQKSTATAISRGEIVYFGPIIFGLCYLFILVPRGRYIFRIISALTLAVTLGLNELQTLASIYATNMAYARVTDWSRAVAFVLYFCAVLYFVFGKKFEKPLYIPRVIGMYAMFAFAALMVPGSLYTFVDNVVPTIGTVSRSTPALILAGIAFLGILVDILRTRKVITVKAPTK